MGALLPEVAEKIDIGRKTVFGKWLETVDIKPVTFKHISQKNFSTVLKFPESFLVVWIMTSPLFSK